MKERKPFLKKFSLKTKIFSLIVLVILYAVLVAVQFVCRHRNENSTNESSPGFATETMEESMYAQIDDNVTLPSAGSDETDSATETAEMVSRVPIKNLDPLATQIMGSNADLLEEKLYEYNLNHGIMSTQATLLEAAASVTRDKTMEFYIENEDGSLVTLFWDPYYQTADAEKCQYTKEDIENNVWIFSEGEPVEHGITPEEEEKFFERMEETDTQRDIETEGSKDAGSQTEDTDPVPESNGQ